MSEKETVSFNEEIQAITLYLELEKMRFKDHFHYQINTTKVEDCESIEIPPMLTQPYIENAIKHGLLYKKDAKILNIEFITKDNLLLVYIEDNGVGRKKANELNHIKNSKHQSFATNANEKRLNMLNQGKSSKVAVKITDQLDLDGNSAGTKVRITIPID